MDRVIVFDTTLRDGEQAPGFSMNTMEKLEMARQLARLQVDVIEAGFPISSDEDKGASTDVIEASARAYLSALNRFARSSSQRTKEVGP
jgi:2-isopropylmalate synthase